MSISALHQKKIAVVGSGISGLSCAWLLNQHHDITLFEKDDRLGGHSNTVSCELNNNTVDVDTGFIVFNPVNYPNLVQLFRYLDVTTVDTDMSFAVSVNHGQLEYSGSGLAGLFAQRSNLLKPGFWKMLADLMRFYRESETMAQEAEEAFKRYTSDTTLGDLLEANGYGNAFINHHLLPMGAAIWSTPADKMLNYPAAAFLRFCRNHGLSQISDRPQWRTVLGGSKTYVDKFAEALQGKIRLNSRIHRIIRRQGQVIVEDHHGKQEFFDHIVLACHSDQALALLDQPSSEEQRLLGSIPYQRNKAFLHTDNKLMPKRRSVWSSWNYLAEGDNSTPDKLAVTYWMNQLQPLNTELPLFVTLNPPVEPDSDKILRTIFYDHPEFGRDALRCQQTLWSLQGEQNTWFCGAYFGYGFHEDGLQAGLAVAEQLGGIPRPWQLEQPSNRIYVKPVKTPSGYTPPLEQVNG